MQKENLTVTVDAVELYQFKRQWPCNNIPDAIASVAFGFDHRGDLVESEYFDESGATFYQFSDDQEHDMGAAIVALSQDCQAFLFDGKAPAWTI